MKDLLNKNWIFPKINASRKHHEHLLPQAKEMLGRGIAYINISRTLGVSEQVIAQLLNVPERY